jgi:multicomponent K+:H+ antiporter subunit A
MRPTPRFFGYLLGFTASMLGVVIAGDVIQLVVFWELTGLFSFLLIGFWYGREKSRAAARTALMTTAMGGLFLLGGVLVLGEIVGSYALDDILSAGPAVVEHPLLAWALVPILIGAFTKSAQAPFHGWLPQAMAAPTPVSAFLHSATLVKAGVFLLARMWPVFSSSDLWVWLVAGSGMVTLLLGAWRAMFQDDLKGLLAYSTLSHLGLITFLLGLGLPLAAFTAIFHLINHAMFKAALFMSAGSIEHETGTRSLAELGGLRRAMPYTTVLTFAAAAAMAGVPLLSGFVSKEMFFAQVAGFGGGGVQAALVLAATLAGAMSIAYALRMCVKVFPGPETEAARQAHEAPLLMLAPAAVLVLGCVAIGVAPAFFMSRALDLAAGDLLGGATSASKLVLWHGVDLPLFMSIAAFLVGGAIWWWLGRNGQSWSLRTPWTAGLARIKDLLGAAPAFLEALLAPAKLQRHVFMVFAVLLLLMAMMLRWSDWMLSPARQAIDPAFAGLWAAGAACAVGAAAFAGRRRVTAIVLTGGAGLVTAVTFTWFSSPDLAITQLLVEIITTILLLLGLRWLPEQDRGRQGARSGNTRPDEGRDDRPAIGRRARRSGLWRHDLSDAPGGLPLLSGERL